MLLNARKEVGFTVNLKAVKKDQFKSEDTRQENQQTPEWSWKKQQQTGGDQQQPGANWVVDLVQILVQRQVNSLSSR